MIWSPYALRVYGLMPRDLLKLTPEQLRSFQEDKPQPLI
jgi:hypothetical protein